MERILSFGQHPATPARKTDERIYARALLEIHAGKTRLRLKFFAPMRPHEKRSFWRIFPAAESSSNLRFSFQKLADTKSTFLVQNCFSFIKMTISRAEPRAADDVLTYLFLICNACESSKTQQHKKGTPPNKNCLFRAKPHEHRSDERIIFLFFFLFSCSRRPMPERPFEAYLPPLPKKDY